MEAEVNELCCGCLSSDRKMKYIRDLSNNLSFRIFSDIPAVLHNASLLICWECESHIASFISFTKQLQSCCEVLQNYVRGNPLPKSVSKLQTCSQVNIDSTQLNFIHENVCYNSHVKISTESDKDIQIKDEIDSDDNKSLLEIHNEEIKEVKDTKRGVKKKVKKKGRKEKRLQKQKKIFEEIYLTPEQIEEERTMMSQKEEYVNAMFKCEKCIIPFPNEDDLRDHVLIKHELHSAKFICNICTCSFGALSSLSYHIGRHSRRRRCNACPYTCVGERQLVVHYQGTHCASDTFDISTKLYQNDEQTKPVDANGLKSEEQFPCDLCQKTFRWKTSLRKHVETHRIEAGQKRKPYCETCRKSFTTTSNLQKHVKTSSKHQIQLKLRNLVNEPLKDPDETARDIENIKSNINSKKEKYACNQCDKKFQWKGNLWRHMQSHVARANGSLVCSPCNRTFSSIATFTQHMKISKKHVTENDFKYMCSDCGKKFSNKIKLKDHIDWDHLKNYTHTCSDCQKVFKSHTSLYLHRQVVHKKVNAEHLCDHCGKSYPNKTKLGNHISALHMRESPYSCGICSARFSWHSCLSRHMRRVHKNMHKSVPVTRT